VPAIKRLFVVSNKDGTNTLTVKRGATSVAIASGKLALLYTDGTTDGLFAADVAVVASDEIEASADATLADLVWTLKGTL
jgi:hypothetical protein